ncbi:MAG TPA: DUF1989 domain-containing protein, partial [Candidatus Baltobacteraceae bacterium]|nr:DUF1989 domain-containing protein [Candidatus Baltobacteraceae bacterium]
MDLPISFEVIEIPPQSGVALRLRAGEVLEIIAVAAEQVADLAILDATDVRNAFSAGRTIDYNERIRLTKGDTLYSHRSTPLMTIIED